MVDLLDASLAPSPDAFATSVGDETVLLHVKSGLYFGMNEVGSRIWQAVCDGRAARAECKVIAEEFGVAESDVEADALAFLSDLEANKIIVATS